ncbi:MAG TPA: DinB family protein [Gemmatimonadaceae bacterium]|nr:DinB family protein [Gemmatimonadaceae bacterium]
MTVAELIDLYEFNRWAHERCLAAAAELNSEEYGRGLPGSFPSLRATLEHLLAAEVVWLSRWEGHSLGDPPDYGGCKDVGSLTSLWNSFWNRQRSFLEALTEDDLGRLVGIRTRSGIETVQPLADTMIHVVNHSTYHRGQVATQMRQLGTAAPSTDYFTYCLTRAADQSTDDSSGSAD